MVAKKQVLCKEKITSRSNFRKWAVKNHPDKLPKNLKSPERREASDRFAEISNYVDELLPDSSSTIDCPSPSPKRSSKKQPKSPSPSSPSPSSPAVNSSNRSYMTASRGNNTTYKEEKLPVNLKKAQCFRNVENWSKIQKHHRFDKPSFDKPSTVEDMKYMSPKLVEMMKTIEKLDKEDDKKFGKRFKHFIFSDVKKGGYGAKIIASAMIANGFNHCFTRNMSIVKPEANDEKHTLGLLSSTALYDKPMTEKNKKSILSMYNNRPDNIYGEDMRFIIFDSGFKEGIDLFDVKYVHIFENQRTAADLTQAVGRATRSCGQKGLNFVPNEGWKLHVYQYYLTYSENENARIPFDDYLLYSGVNLNMHQFTENLEKLAVHTAVDYELNKNINSYEQKVDEKMDEVLMLENDRMLTGGASVNLGCKKTDKCGLRATKTVPFSLQLLESVYKGVLPKNYKKYKSKSKRTFFCKLLIKDPEFCAAVNEKYNAKKKTKKTYTNKELMQLVAIDEEDEEDEKRMVMKSESNKSSSSSSSTDRASSSSSARQSAQQFGIYEESKAKDEEFDFESLEDMPFHKFQQYINKTFAKYKYDPIKVTNLCDAPADSASKDKDERLVDYTNSQAFVTNYFTPQNFTKGLLVWHSVGTGKTCTAISVKSFLFERQDYSVIWVTRKTLKEDIWKNMYDKICDHIIREKYTGTEDAIQLKKHLSKKFLPPMSYRQFSNMLAGKNELYRKLVSINGEEDILKNTLVIVDEAHKLYSTDLVPLEKPNMSIVEKKLEESPTCKVILMTGTPITDDPMEFTKLMNLVMKKDKFPVTFKDFHKQFLSGNKFTRKGVREFQKRTKGLISYLNRRYDPRQFAQPVFHAKPVKMVKSDFSMDDCTKKAEDKLEECIKNLDDDDDTSFDDTKLNQLIDDVNKLKKIIDEDKKRLKNDKNNVDLKDRILRNKLDLDVLKEKVKDERKSLKNNRSNYTKGKAMCKRRLTQAKKECKEEAKQFETYQDSMFKKC